MSSSRPQTAIAARIRYLASCHEADNRESAIFDLFHKDVRHRHFFTGTEVLLSGLQDAVAVPEDIGIAALEEASLYKRERSLVYGAFVVAGSAGRRLAAPLLYYPATLHRTSQGAVFLRIDASDPALNFPVLAELLGEDAGALDAIARRIPSPPFGEIALSDLMEVFRELVPRVRVDALYRYPALDSEREVRSASRGEGAIRCLPAAAMALVENPRSSRGVLSELARLGAAERHSPPLEVLLGRAESALPASDPAPALAAIPAVLSRPQQKVLRSARRNALSLIVGPPGTGKSYTVTALASRLLQTARRERIAGLLEKHRPVLKRFSSAVRARTSGRQEALFEEMNLEILLGAFPLWISTFRDLHRFVPFEAEMFDLVVVDEATQSDMASPLPALYRGRRAAVTGDPKQLRHVSFLSRDRQRRLGEEAGLAEADLASLDYREMSLLDLVDDRLSSQEQVAFLDEHFRSMPQIIDFSNREFYGGGLRIMTARPGTLRRRAVHLRPTAGRRDESGVNSIEAEALADDLLHWVEAERRLAPEQSHSLGVLSPFRDQVDHLLGLLTAKRRAGLSIFPLSHFAWLSDRDSALDALERHFDRTGG